MRIRVLLVDDSEVVRVGLAAVLGQDPGIEIVGMGATSYEAVAQAQALEPDVALLDVRLPDEGGIEAGRRILELLPDTRVVFLSAFADDELVRAAIVIGAHGYLLKEVDVPSLIDSIKRVAGGERLLDAGLRSNMLEWVMQNVPAGTALEAPPLSDKQQQIVALVAAGMTNNEIAAALDLSPKTVKNYLHRIFEKLGIQRRSQAAAHHARLSGPSTISQSG
ncbi:MAG: response regulator transcription factor [Gemmatimonadales bacterium]|nr:response regulator transcription factor [Gemmatimonadales bacterium]